MFFEDFMEAIARVTDMRTIPTDEDFEEMNVKNLFQFYEAKAKEGITSEEIPSRESSEFSAPKTRPLHEKLEKLIVYVCIKNHVLHRDFDPATFDANSANKPKTPKPGSRGGSRGGSRQGSRGGRRY